MTVSRETAERAMNVVKRANPANSSLRKVFKAGQSDGTPINQLYENNRHFGFPTPPKKRPRRIEGGLSNLSHVSMVVS